MTVPQETYVIDAVQGEAKSSLRKKVEAASGGKYPAEHQKLLMGGIAQLMVADKRGPIEFGTCGWTTGLGLAVMTAEQGAKPHVPRPSPNRLDNRGTWSEGWNPKKG